MFEIDTKVNPNTGWLLVKKWKFGEHITTGPNGLRNSPKSGDDEAKFDIGKGEPNTICITAGTGGLDTVEDDLGGDDVIDLLNDCVRTGSNGVCETTAHANDNQVILPGNGMPNRPCIGPGPDGELNSTPTSDDISKDGSLSGLYKYEMGFDARDQPGVPGQGNNNPPGSFGLHYIVKYNNKIYDPSYGIDPCPSENDYENAAFAGFHTPNGACKKNDTTTKELDFTPRN